MAKIWEAPVLSSLAGPIVGLLTKGQAGTLPRAPSFIARVIQIVLTAVAALFVGFRSFWDATTGVLQQQEIGDDPQDKHLIKVIDVLKIHEAWYRALYGVQFWIPGPLEELYQRWFWQLIRAAALPQEGKTKRCRITRGKRGRPKGSKSHATEKPFKIGWRRRV